MKQLTKLRAAHKTLFDGLVKKWESSMVLRELSCTGPLALFGCVVYFRCGLALLWRGVACMLALRCYRLSCERVR
jgi:hypothetical protein